MQSGGSPTPKYGYFIHNPGSNDSRVSEQKSCYKIGDIRRLIHIPGNVESKGGESRGSPAPKYGDIILLHGQMTTGYL